MLQNRYTFCLSRRLGLLALGGVFSALLGAFSGCNTAPKGPVSVPLEFRPRHSDPIAMSLPATDAKVHLEAVKDKRANKEEIGRNVEDATPIPVYSTGKSPAEFVREVLETELRNLGLELTDAPESADRIVSVDLNKFYCEESNNYNAQVGGLAEVREKSGRTLWKGTIAGQSENFGRSRSPTNYQETFSDATRRAVGSLLSNPKFAAALAK